MIAEIAHGLTWLAFGCAALLLLAAWRLPTLMVPAALALGWLWLWIAGLWLWPFWTVDLSVAAVAANTHSRLPGGLRLAAALLCGAWLVVAALVAWGAAAIAIIRPAARYGFAAAGGMALLLNTIVLIEVQPFARLSPAPVEGAGFDPAWRDRLARPLPTTPVFVGVLAVGATSGQYRLAAVTPVAGEDSTGVVAELRIGGDPIVLTPEWRETILPRHAASVPDSAWHGSDWWRASLGRPRADGRWLVSVERVRVWPYALGLMLGGVLLGVWLRRAR